MNPAMKATNHIELARIKPSALNPRKSFDTASFDALVNSVKAHGVLQPITVRQMGDDQPNASHCFEIVLGESRFRAAQIAGLKTIPVQVRQGETSDALLVEMALVENLQRNNLNPIEEGDGFAAMLELSPKLTQGELAQRVGRDQSYISNAMRLRTLPREVKELVARGVDPLPRAHAVVLVAIAEHPDCVKLAQNAVREKQTTRDVEKAVKGIKNAHPSQKAEGAATLRPVPKDGLVGGNGGDYIDDSNGSIGGQIPRPVTLASPPSAIAPPSRPAQSGSSELPKPSPTWDTAGGPGAVLLRLGGYEATGDLINAVKTDPEFRKTVYLSALALPMAAYEALGGVIK